MLPPHHHEDQPRSVLKIASKTRQPPRQSDRSDQQTSRPLDPASPALQVLSFVSRVLLHTVVLDNSSHAVSLTSTIYHELTICNDCATISDDSVLFVLQRGLACMKSANLHACMVSTYHSSLPHQASRTSSPAECLGSIRTDRLVHLPYSYIHKLSASLSCGMQRDQSCRSIPDEEGEKRPAKGREVRYVGKQSESIPLALRWSWHSSTSASRACSTVASSPFPSIWNGLSACSPVQVWNRR